MSDDSSKVQYHFAAAQQGDQLVLTITNSGTVDKPAPELHVLLAVDIPSVVLPEYLQQLAQTAVDKGTDQLLAGDQVSLAGGAGVWSAWVQSIVSQQARIGAKQDGLQQTATVQIALKNDSDSSGTGVDDAGRLGWIARDKPLILKLPLSLKQAAIVELITRYGYGADVDPVWGLQLSDDTLAPVVVPLAPPGSPSLPPVAAASDVELRLSDRGRAYVRAGSEATIHWSLPDGVKGTLFGPLSGGHTSMAVTGRGQQTVTVVTHQAYVLQAEVKGVLVARTLTLDVQSPDKLGYLELEPAIALPYGVVRAHWAVRAVSKAFIDIDGVTGAVLHRDDTQDDFSGYGVYDVLVKVLVKSQQTVNVSLNVDVRAAQKDSQYKSGDKSLSASIQVHEWQPWSLSGLPDEPLLALAYAAGTTRTGAHEALLACTGSALFLCTSPGDETLPARFNRLDPGTTVDLDCWLDVSATGDGFVALRRLKSGAIELVRYDVTGSAVGDPTAPPLLQGLAAACVRVLGERAYVIGSDNQTKAVAVSLNLSHPLEAPVVEPALSFAKDAAFVVVGDALYVLHRPTATLLRYEQKENSKGGFGTLSTPAVASAAPADARAMLSQCALVAVEGLLVALGNGWQTGVEVNGERESWPQDLVYNPQTDRWTTCGHGLDCDQSWRVVYRNGQSPRLSPRLWALNAQKPAESKTLFVPDEHLFAADYWTGAPVRSLTTSYLSATQTFSSKLPADAVLQAVDATNPVFIERLEDGSLRVAYNTVSSSNVRGLWATGAEGKEIAIPGCWATFGGVRYCLAWGSAVLTGLRPRDLDLSDTDFTLAPTLDFSRAMLAGANLQRANLFGVKLAFANLNHPSEGPYWSGADLRGAKLAGADLTMANLRGAIIDDTTVLDEKWRRVWEIVNGRQLHQDGKLHAPPNCIDADLSNSDLAAAPLTNVKLTNANLDGASLKSASLGGADLSGARLQGADLSEADLLWATLTGAHADKNTRWPSGWPRSDDNVIVDE